METTQVASRSRQVRFLQVFASRGLATLAGVALLGASILFVNHLRRRGPKLVVGKPVIHLSSREGFVETAVPLQNKGDRALHIEQISSTCGCVRAEPSSREIAPGGTAELKLKIVLLPVGVRTVAITLQCNDAVHPETRIIVHAEKTRDVPYVARQPEPVAITCTEGEPPTAAVHFLTTLEFRSHMPWVRSIRSSIDLIEPRLDLDGEEVTNDPAVVKRNYRVSILPMQSTTTQGTVDGRIDIFANPDFSGEPITTWRLSYRRSAAIVAIPNTIRLRATETSDANAKFAVLSSLPHNAWSVEEIQTADDWLEVRQGSDRGLLRAHFFEVWLSRMPPLLPARSEIVIHTSLAAHRTVSIEIDCSQ